MNLRLGLGLSDRASGPALGLNFLSGTLDPRITFTRGSNATLVDATGRITYAPANLLTFSEQLDNAAWTKQGLGVAIAPTVTANAGIAPDGTMTADRVQLSLNGGTTLSDSSQIVQGVTFADATYIFSVWLKSNTGLSQTVVLLNVNSGGPAETVTTEWTRFTRLVSTAATASNAGVRIRGTVTGATADILVWGAQLEPVTYQTLPSTYVATTASAYYGPRFDYDPVTLAPKGLLIEEQRTNLLTYSEQFDNAVYVKDNVTVAANAAVSPSGAATADNVIENTAAGIHRINQAFTATVSVVYTATMYVKPVGNRRLYVNTQVLLGVGALFDFAGSGSVISVTGAAGNRAASITPVGGGWFRCAVVGTGTGTPANVHVQINTSTSSTAADESYLGDGTSGLSLYGAQLEAGSFATSYIPTVASTVTRSADVATMTGTNFTSWYNQSEGTWAAQFSGNGSYAVVANDGTTNNYNGITYNSPTSVRGVAVAGGVFAGVTMTGGTAGTVNKTAYGYRIDGLAGSTNGGGVVGTVVSAIPTVTQMLVGSYGGFGQLNGHIRSIVYYNTRLPNATLQALTA